MSKALTVLNDENLPAHIRRALETTEGNIEARLSVPSLTYGGKKWTMVLNGEPKLLQKRDENGELEPATTIPVVILDYAKRRGRTYYEGAYDPEKPGKPLCWSDDGITPHKSISEPQAKKCADCPLSQKGSKVNEQGKSVVACSEHRMLAVVPANKLDMEPLRLKLAITSDYDGQSPDLAEREWFAFSNYKDFLRAGGIHSTYLMFTKLRFDPNTDYAKVIFHRGDWLSEAQLEIVKAASESDAVKALLAGSWTPEGADGQQVAERAEPVAPPAKPKPKVQVDEDDLPPAKPKVKQVADDDVEILPPAKPKGNGKPVQSKPFTDDDIELTTTPKAKQAEVAAKQQARKAAALDEDADIVDDDAPPAKPKAKAKQAAAEEEPPAKPKGGKALAAVLDDWGDDE